MPQLAAQIHVPDADLVESPARTRSRTRLDRARRAAIAGKWPRRSSASRSSTPPSRTCEQHHALPRHRPQSVAADGDDRTSLMFCVQDKPGALFSALEPFNRLKDQHEQDRERPSKRKAWEFFFLSIWMGTRAKRGSRQRLRSWSSIAPS
jgi:chorismate mutase/prephenate dehydratase